MQRPSLPSTGNDVPLNHEFHVEGEGWYWQLYHVKPGDIADENGGKGGPYPTQYEAYRHGSYERDMYYDCLDAE
jgi:hypothetical protein